MLGQLALGGGGVVLGCGGAPAREGAVSPTPADSQADGRSAGARARILREHEVRPLPFDPASLNGLSERLIRSHHENNYAGAVRNLNACRRRLAEAPDDTAGFVWGGLAKSELVFANSALLHELYFQNLGGDGRATSETVTTAVSGAFADESAGRPTSAVARAASRAGAGG